MEWEDKPEVEDIIDDLSKIGDVGQRLIEATNDAKTVAEFKRTLLDAIAKEKVKLAKIVRKGKALKED